MAPKITIKSKQGRAVGGVWIDGSVGTFRFQALIFPEHSDSDDYELDGSYISKLWLADRAGRGAYNWDRGPDRDTSTAAAEAAVQALKKNLARMVFGAAAGKRRHVGKGVEVTGYKRHWPDMAAVAAPKKPRKARGQATVAGADERRAKVDRIRKLGRGL